MQDTGFQRPNRGFPVFGAAMLYTGVVRENGLENVLQIGGLQVATKFCGEAPCHASPRSDFSSTKSLEADLSLNVLLDQQSLGAAVSDQLLFDSGGVWRFWQNRLKPHEHMLEVFNQAENKKRALSVLRYDFTEGSGILQVAKNSHGLGSKHHPLVYPLDELLWIQLLSQRQGFILHAFGCLAEAGAICFAGISGAGKTTLSHLFSKNLPYLTQLSDDRVIVRKAGAEFKAYGTPWHGDACIWSTKGAPIEVIFLIEHGRQNRLRPLNATQALTGLLVRSFPTLYQRQTMDQTMDTLMQLVQTVPVYALECVPNEELFAFLESELHISLAGQAHPSQANTMEMTW